MTSKETSIGFAALKEKILAKSGKEYWRSVEEYVDSPEFEDFVKEEYPAHAEEWDSSLSRRNFIKVMGASLAFAGLSGCVIQPAEKIIPYVTQPEGLMPGKAQYYATAMTVGGVSTGLFAKAHEGRPTKIEGNPFHPGSRGGTDVYAQASILNLYDPDRSKGHYFRATSTSWKEFINKFRAAVEENRNDGGSGVRILTGTIGSPTTISQIDQIKQEMPNAKWVQYEPINNDSVLQGAKLAFGSPAQPIYSFDKAERVLSLDSDFFAAGNSSYAKDFAKGRDPEKGESMIRLYAIETSLSLVGAKADHRIAVKPSEMVAFAKAVATELGVSGADLSAEEKSAVEKRQDWIKEMAADLKAAGNKTLVVPGERQPAYVHAIANAINSTLGAVGNTVTFIDPLVSNADQAQTDQMKELVEDIDNGKVKILLVAGTNPTYAAPSDLRLTEERMKKVDVSVHVGERIDETGRLCKWQISGLHFLEDWGDGRAFDGTITLAQPLVKPLYNGRSLHEVLQLMMKENFEMKSLDIVKAYWQKQGMKAPAAAPVANATEATSAEAAATPTPEATPQADAEATPEPPSPELPAEANKNFFGDEDAEPVPDNGTAPAPTSMTFEQSWRKAVHDGFVPNTASPAKSVALTTAFMSDAPESSGEGSLEVVIMPDPAIYDGRYVNNGWLQELPNPLTKITWDNVALISPNTAQELGVNQDKRYEDYAGGALGRSMITTKGGNMESDMLKVTVDGTGVEQEVPAWIAPGQPDGVITLFLGYGRSHAGTVALDSEGNARGYDAYGPLKSSSMWATKGSIENTRVRKNIASTQIHFNMEGRDLVRNWEVGEIEELGKEHKAVDYNYKKSLYGNAHKETYEKHDKWGMTIDMNACNGCNACVIACQSENNIPVVGKEQVERSREMHWLRIDTYYKGDVSEPDGPHFQPVLCQQCEQAPCEVVCPVHATVHSAEGLNDMVYNRCIGTRYCANNCPYKVRRFNFLLYQDWDSEQAKLMRNPDVTVRSRGVMEKCTYCTQRISAARIEAEKDGRDVRDGEILTACQSACPSDAIAFGNLHDKESKVAKMKENHRNYEILNYELNTQPRTSYLAGVSNPNKKMPGYEAPKREKKGH